MIAVVGGSSLIARELASIEPVTGLRLGAISRETTRYLICVGLLLGREIRASSDADILRTIRANFHDIAFFLDHLFAQEPHARACVIGSESGFSGSFDMSYAAAKAGLHLYVETKKLAPEQQLVCIAPGIIADAGMTVRRADQEAVALRAAAHPKMRHCTSREVASLASWLLGPDGSFVSGTTVRMNGGERR